MLEKSAVVAVYGLAIAGSAATAGVSSSSSGVSSSISRGVNNRGVSSTGSVDNRVLIAAVEVNPTEGLDGSTKSRGGAGNQRSAVVAGSNNNPRVTRATRVPILFGP